jgi:hypothetical protein
MNYKNYSLYSATLPRSPPLVSSSAIPLCCKDFNLLIQHLTLWGYIHFLSDLICEKAVNHLAFYHWTQIKISGVNITFMAYHWALTLNTHDDCISNAIQESHSVQSHNRYHKMSLSPNQHLGQSCSVFILTLETIFAMSPYF